MGEHVWTVLCQTTLSDTGTNVISLIELMEKLILHPREDIPDIAGHIAGIRQAGDKGLLLPVRLQLVSRWLRSEASKPETFSAKITLFGPEGEQLFQQVVPVDLSENYGQRLTLNFEVLPITTLGRYWFVIEQPSRGKKKDGWTIATRIPLEVVQAETASSA